MAKNKKKKGKIGISVPAPTRQPRTEEIPIPFYKLRPAWRISKLEMCDPFGWHELDRGKLEYIRQKFADFESSTWNDILLVAKKQNHSIPLNELSKKAQQRLAALSLDDADEVISLRLSGKERVFGIRHDVALTILWWDPEHEVCPSLLKHT
jgi:hypothetical protein